MPEVTIRIGGRDFEVACQEGEEHYLRAAAQMLDTEASALVNQIGRMPEARMLLMAGLMLADKTAGAQDQITALQRKLAEAEAALGELQAGGEPEPRTIEVPVVPQEVLDTLAELTARTEALADAAEEKAGAA